MFVLNLASCKIRPFWYHHDHVFNCVLFVSTPFRDSPRRRSWPSQGSFSCFYSYPHSQERARVAQSKPGPRGRKESHDFLVQQQISYEHQRGWNVCICDNCLDQLSPLDSFGPPRRGVRGSEERWHGSIREPEPVGLLVGKWGLFSIFITKLTKKKGWNLRALVWLNSTNGSWLLNFEVLFSLSKISHLVS